MLFAAVLLFSPAVAALVTRRITIFRYGATESLNAAAVKAPQWYQKSSDVTIPSPSSHGDVTPAV